MTVGTAETIPALCFYSQMNFKEDFLTPDVRCLSFEHLLKMPNFPSYRTAAQKMSLPRNFQLKLTLATYKSANFAARTFFFWVKIAYLMGKIITAKFSH